MKKNELTMEQEMLVNKIMEENSIQRRVDDIVEKTKLAMNIYQSESQQTKVDKIVAEQLETK